MLHNLPAPARDAVLLVGRVVLGIVLIAHGAQKLFTWGLGTTISNFGQMGVPVPPVSATFAVVVELVGGALLIVGALTPYVGALVVVNMLGASLIVHVGNGVFASNGGWELTGVLAAFAAVFVVVGAGSYSVDHVLAGRRREPAAA